MMTHRTGAHPSFLFACSTQCSEIFCFFFFFLFILPSSQKDFSVLTLVSLFSSGERRGKPDTFVTRARVDAWSSSLSLVPLTPTSRVLPTQGPRSLAFWGRFCVSPLRQLPPSQPEPCDTRLAESPTSAGEALKCPHTPAVAPATLFLWFNPFMVSLPSRIRQPSFRVLNAFGMG